MRAAVESMPELEVDERAIVITRVFAAPRKMVYAAFADPEQVVEWWGPRGFTATVEVMDLHAGGKWEMVMHGPDGTDYRSDITFTEVVPERRIRLNLVGGKIGAEPVRMSKIITFEDEGEGTRLTFRLEFASRDERGENVRAYGAVEGGRQTFERLNEFLAKKGI